MTLEINEIQEEIDRNKLYRVKWSEIYGHSLGKEVGNCYRKGYKWEKTYEHLKTYLNFNNDEYDELCRRLKIGVCSIYSTKKV